MFQQTDRVTQNFLRCRPRNEWPDLIPLHLMDRPKNGGTDYLLATSKVEIEAAHTAGYNLRTIQGYIYQPCTPESTCVPPAAQKLWRQYKVADNDCAVFLDSEKPSFEAAGYTAACPTGATKMIGYAYPATDKRLQRERDRIRLLPRNPAYAPIVVSPSQDFAIEGLYCGLVRRD